MVTKLVLFKLLQILVVSAASPTSEMWSTLSFRKEKHSVSSKTYDLAMMTSSLSFIIV